MPIFLRSSKDLPELVEKLRSFGTVVSKTEQVDTALVNIDYESEFAVYKHTKENRQT